MNKLEHEKLKRLLKKLQHKIDKNEITTTEQVVQFATKELKKTGLYVSEKEATLELIRE